MGRAHAQALKDLAVLRRVCTPRGLYHYNDDDRHGRSPEQLVAECIRRGASFPPDLITAINDAELAVPSKLHRDAFLSLLEFLFKDKEQFVKQNAGVGCRIPKPDPRAYERRCKTAAEKGKPTPKKPAPESLQYQLSSNSNLDHGAFSYLREWYDKALARLQAGKGSQDDEDYVPICRRFLSWYKACKTVFGKVGFIITQLHFVFYFEGGGMTLHRDGRLTHKRSRRAIFAAPPRPPVSGAKRKRPSRAVTRKRLTFFVGQPVVPRERGKKGRYDDAMNTHGALCFGKADGAVLMTGKGAGGVELIPAGHVDMSGDWAKAGYEQHEWPAVYLYHVPWIKKAPFKGAPAGAASYVVSGYSIADGDESSDSDSD